MLRERALAGLADYDADEHGGAYLQDQVALTSKLKVTGGIRYDIAKHQRCWLLRDRELF